MNTEPAGATTAITRIISMRSTIRRYVVTLAMIFFALSVAPAQADFQKGFDAFNRGDYAVAIKEWRSLAERGDPNAQFYVGHMYHDGLSVAQNYREAAKWFRRAAENGSTKAQQRLGALYKNGLGVSQDYAEAAKWYRKAAEQGNFYAQNNLGFMYGKGQGVPQDYVQAHMWFNLATSRLPPGTARDKAVENRDIAAKLMTPAQIAEAQRLAREWKPKKERP